MIIVAALIGVFGTVVMTGPACADWRARRRRERDAPIATVVYLPNAACRESTAPSRPFGVAFCLCSRCVELPKT